uniref:Uncharacterized protein n=1 Tax=Lepeophtheirus salmonis TaxID=72036 RepID=A0A0K2TSQ3_LEPSM
MSVEVHQTRLLIFKGIKLTSRLGKRKVKMTQKSNYQYLQDLNNKLLMILKW